MKKKSNGGLLWSGTIPRAHLIFTYEEGTTVIPELQ